jgi:hypothetical protein
MRLPEITLKYLSTWCSAGQIRCCFGTRIFIQKIPPFGPVFGQLNQVHTYRMGTGGSFPRSKRPDHEGDHSSPSSAEIKNVWS